MRFSALLDPSRIKIPIEARDRVGVWQELARLVAPEGEADLEEIVRAVEEREALLSTAIGHEVALPHARVASLPALRVAAGRTPQPIPYDSAGERTATLFFLIVGPEDAAGDHVKALSRIARLTRRPEVRGRLLGAATAEEFYRFICDADAN